MICDILEFGSKLPFLWTSSNAEFSNNYSDFKYFEFANASINEMLRAGAIKESLAKPKVTVASVNKREKG